MSKRQIVLLICILVLAGILRFAYVGKCDGKPLGGDEVSYDSIAWNLVTIHKYAETKDSGEVSLTARRGPAYTFFLAGIYSVAGHNTNAVRAMQVVLELLSCFLLFRIGLSIFKRVDIGLIAAFFYAVYPSFIMNTGRLITETLVSVFFMLSLYGFLSYSVSGWRRGLYIAAMAAGIAALNKPILVLLPVMFFIANWGMMPGRQLVKDLIVQLVLVALMLSPWIARNAIAFNAFIPGVTQGGFTFWGGTGPADGMVVGGPKEPIMPTYALDAVKGLTEVQREKWFYRDGIKIIKENPKRYALLMLKKASRFWFDVRYEEPFWERGKFNSLFHMIAILIAGLGIIILKPKRNTSLLLGLLALYFTAVHMVFFSVFRYSGPVYAYIFCFSAGGVVAICLKLAPVWKWITSGKRA